MKRKKRKKTRSRRGMQIKARGSDGGEQGPSLDLLLGRATIAVGELLDNPVHGEELCRKLHKQYKKHPKELEETVKKRAKGAVVFRTERGNPPDQMQIDLMHSILEEIFDFFREQEGT